MYDFTTKTETKKIVFYMRRIGAYGPENYQLMETMKKWAEKNGRLSSDAEIYGIALDNPQTTRPELCRYDVCLVAEGQALAPQMPQDGEPGVRAICGGCYAVFLVAHTPQDVAWCYSQIMSSELPFDLSRPVMERYRLSLVDKGWCEIMVPVASDE